MKCSQGNEKWCWQYRGEMGAGDNKGNENKSMGKMKNKWKGHECYEQ